MSIPELMAPRGVPTPDTEVRAAPTPSPRVLRRLVRRPVALICLLYLAVLVVIAVVAPIVLPNIDHQVSGNLSAVLQGPSLHHLLGTDSLGRDVLDRVLVGTRYAMLGVLEACVAAIGIGVPMGIAAGYFGGWIDRAVGWITDLSFAMPAIALLMVVVVVFAGSEFAAMVTLGVLGAPQLSRVVRGATLSVREEPYIAAAQVAGLSDLDLMVRHVRPRIAGGVIVFASLFAAMALLAESGLAFLGLVLPAPEPSWGGMIADGITNLSRQAWLIWPPGIVMTLTVVAFGLLGQEVGEVNTETWAPASARRATRRKPRRPRSRRRDKSASQSSPVTSDALLEVEDLTIDFPGQDGPITVIQGVSFRVQAGETLGLVGESGCGKTVTSMALMKMVPGNGEISGGRICFDGRDIAAMGEREVHRIRGREIGLISQDPMLSLNPVFRVGWQLSLAIRTHHNVDRREARERAVELLRMVHLPEPELVARRYPHELSGGMAQRVSIARALAAEPKLLIADEPTTALDVTVQAEILALLRELQESREMAVLLVTHDWGVVADLCQRAVVMYAGEVVEEASVLELFDKPRHPYTAALLASNPHQLGVGPLPAIPGEVAVPGSWPEGCHFAPRCSYSTDACRTHAIQLYGEQGNRRWRCIHPLATRDPEL